MRLIRRRPGRIHWEEERDAPCDLLKIITNEPRLQNGDCNDVFVELQNKGKPDDLSKIESFSERNLNIPRAAKFIPPPRLRVSRATAAAVIFTALAAIGGIFLLVVAIQKFYRYMKHRQRMKQLDAASDHISKYGPGELPGFLSPPTTEPEVKKARIASRESLMFSDGRRPPSVRYVVEQDGDAVTRVIRSDASSSGHPLDQTNTSPLPSPTLEMSRTLDPALASLPPLRPQASAASRTSQRVSLTPVLKPVVVVPPPPLKHAVSLKVTPVMGSFDGPDYAMEPHSAGGQLETLSSSGYAREERVKSIILHTDDAKELRLPAIQRTTSPLLSF